MTPGGSLILIPRTLILLPLPIEPKIPAMDIENKLDRDAPDLGGKKPSSGSLSRRLKAELSTNHMDIPILACCLCSGLTDSTLYNGEFFAAIRPCYNRKTARFKC